MAKGDHRKQAKKAPHEYDVPDDVKDKAWSEADTDKLLWPGAYGHKLHPVRLFHSGGRHISVSWRSNEVKPRGTIGLSSWATARALEPGAAAAASAAGAVCSRRAANACSGEARSGKGTREEEEEEEAAG